jgi:hypothetical protein
MIAKSRFQELPMPQRFDIDIEARATAHVLRFRPRPWTPGESGSRRERPCEQVEPGRTYRDVRIRRWLREYWR